MWFGWNLRSGRAVIVPLRGFIEYRINHNILD